MKGGDVIKGGAYALGLLGFFAAISGLDSCGKKEPPQKPAIQFKALIEGADLTITNGGKLDSPAGMAQIYVTASPYFTDLPPLAAGESTSLPLADFANLEHERFDIHRSKPRQISLLPAGHRPSSFKP